jgi:hypothetical protein
MREHTVSAIMRESGDTEDLLEEILVSELCVD